MYRRHLLARVRAALADTPAVALIGPRQSGKTTLARQLAAHMGAQYFTFDDAATLAAASDPAGFIQGLHGAAIIDEVQKAPAVLPAIKVEIDRRRVPGRFLLTGSANLWRLPAVSESLTGRVEVATLYPLSQGELRGLREGLIDALFQDAPLRLRRPASPGQSLEAVIAVGGFPEALARREGRRREAWFDSYVTTLLLRDVRDLSRIEGAAELPRFLRLLAACSSGLLNTSELSRSCGIPNTTLKRYLALLETLFLVQPLAAWSANLGKRLVKAPKLHLVDCGLAMHLLGLSAERLRADRHAIGPLLETFAVGELRKQAAWSETAVTLHHYRSAAGAEVDIVLEDRRGRVAGVEVKAAAGVGRRDFAGLESLAEALSERFVRGVVLYGGSQVVPFGERLHALPLRALWDLG